MDEEGNEVPDLEGPTVWSGYEKLEETRFGEKVYDIGTSYYNGGKRLAVLYKDEQGTLKLEIQ